VAHWTGSHLDSLYPFDSDCRVLYRDSVLRDLKEAGASNPEGGWTTYWIHEDGMSVRVYAYALFNSMELS